MHRLKAALVALLLLSVASPAAAEPVPGFGSDGVAEVPYTLDLFALDDGGFVVVGYDELVGIGPDGRERWTVSSPDWANIWASDGRLVYVETNESLIALDGATGTPAPTFDGDGEVAIEQTGYLVADPRGGVLLFQSDGGRLLRFDDDGSLDDSFAIGGSVAAVGDDGAVFTSGGSPATIRRYTPAGDLDRSWGDDGAVVAGDGLVGFAAAPDGGFVVARTRQSGEYPNNEVHLLRWTPTGDPDPAFGFGGVADAKTRCRGEVVRSLDIADDGTIFLVGASQESRETVPPFVTAFEPNGALRGHETIGTGSPYTITGRDVHLELDLAVQGAGRRLGVVRFGDDDKTLLHAVDVASSFDDPEPDTGYWLVSSQGPYPRGTTSLCAPLTPARHIVGAASGAQPYGYWMVDVAGRIETAGRVPHLGEVSTPLNAPVLGVAARPQGDGYWIIARDGGIFSFGAATFFGSTGGMRLNQPIVGMAPTPSGRGYWLVASDGGIFSFGDASFFGSTGAIRLNQPIVGMASTAAGRGYWLAAADGGLFTFGDAPYLGTGYDSFFGPHEGFVGIITP